MCCINSFPSLCCFSIHFRTFYLIGWTRNWQLSRQCHFAFCLLRQELSQEMEQEVPQQTTSHLVDLEEFTRLSAENVSRILVERGLDYRLLFSACLTRCLSLICSLSVFLNLSLCPRLSLCPWSLPLSLNLSLFLYASLSLWSCVSLCPSLGR